MCICVAVFASSVLAVLVQSSGVPTILAPNSAIKNNSVYYKKDELMKFGILYNVFMFMWAVQFIVHCQHIVIAGAAATWYFIRNKNNLTSPISTSIGRLFSYHLGSVAFGSFIIVFIYIIKQVLSGINTLLKRYDHPIIRCLFNAFTCVFNCFESYISYLTRNAYIGIGKKLFMSKYPLSYC